MVSEEQILVVPTSLFEQLGYFQGFCGDVTKYRDELLKTRHIRFMPRGAAERNPAFKQLIPYMIFCHTNGDGRVSVFRYVRGKGQGESRLHLKRSIGIGGHISSIDLPEDSTEDDALYRRGLRRELEEEVVLRSPYRERCVGLINDDLTEVGRVHLGIVHRFDLDEPDMRSNEPDIIESGFVDVGELMGNLDGFESWSVICLKALFPQSRS